MKKIANNLLILEEILHFLVPLCYYKVTIDVRERDTNKEKDNS